MAPAKAAVRTIHAQPLEQPVSLLIRELLERLGENPARDGLARTPERVSEALRFLTGGYQADVHRIVNGALFEEACDEMVVVKDIEFFSLCEHHMLPFFCMMMRGVEKQHSAAATTAMLGAFRERKETRSEFLALANCRGRNY